MKDETIVRRAYRTPMPVKTIVKQRQGFQKGQSGNPKGRPRGARCKATMAALSLLQDDLQAVTQVCIDRAKEGNLMACKLILDKLIPPARDLPVTFPAPELTSAAGLRAALASILKLVSIGHITPGEAAQLALVVNSLGTNLAIEELEQELDGLPEPGQ